MDHRVIETRPLRCKRSVPPSTPMALNLSIFFVADLNGPDFLHLEHIVMYSLVIVKKMVPPRRLERRTYGLQNRCSTN